MIDLVCFHHAGGGSSLFQDWIQAKRPGLTVHPVTLPGRDARIAERPFERMEPLIEWLEDQLVELDFRQTVFFGHSMGARVAHALSLHRQARGRSLPRALVLSACAPARRLTTPLLSELTKTALLNRLREYDPDNDALMRHPELWDLIEPTLRADFAVIETYDPEPVIRLPIPIIAFSGAADPLVTPKDIGAWADYGSLFKSIVCDGGHFFLRKDPGNILDQVCHALQEFGIAPNTNNSRVLGARNVDFKATAPNLDQWDALEY